MSKQSKTTPIYMKSEFWMSAITCMSGLLLTFGIITPVQSSAIASVAPQIIGAILAMFSSSRFISTQHAAKVEVFRAMCAMRLDRDGEVKATASDIQDDVVAKIAVAAGL